jgi:4'-phosphopantetheinyl transferase
MLSEDERERAVSFTRRADQDDFVTRRALLRRILSRYVGTLPARVAFGYEPYGKPFLDPEHHPQPPSFSLTRARHLSLVAVARDRVGVDVERLDERIDAEGLARQFFCAREAALIRGLPRRDRATAFFTGWTRREAYLKALGLGLGRAPTGLDVTLDAGPAVRVVDDLGQIWWIATLDAGSGHLASVSAEGDAWSVRLMDWPGPRSAPA